MKRMFIHFMNNYLFDSVSSVNVVLGVGVYHNIHSEIFRSIDQVGEKKIRAKKPERV
jgi:hypothetical protein